MSRTLLVALREYRQIAATRGFLVMLLVVPLALAASILAGPLLRPPLGVAFIIADASGRYAPAIERRVELDYQRQILSDLSVYVRRWKAGASDPDAVWASGRVWFGDPQVEAFLASGGVNAALRKIGPHLPQDAPVFKPAERWFLSVPPPANVPTDQGPERFGAALAPYLQGDIATAIGKRPLALAVYIPKGFGQGAQDVRMWTNGRPNAGLIETVRAELTRLARLQALEASGLSPAAAEQIESFNVPLAVTEPPSGGGRDKLFIRSLVPLALVYLLLIAAVTTGAMMLQGVIEERSNKLLEAVIACVRPSELMYGKLLGLGGIGLTVVAVWVTCALGAAFAVQGVVADFLRPSLGALDKPWMVAALIFYFLTGYLIVSALFLAIGSRSNSMQDAQAYLTPVLMAIMLPVVLMMGSALQNPDGLFPRILSWIPFYTPFAMLARLGGGVSPYEVVGTGILLVAFVALELYLLGRVFQANLLNTGQPPKLAVLVKQMFH